MTLTEHCDVTIASRSSTSCGGDHTGDVGVLTSVMEVIAKWGRIVTFLKTLPEANVISPARQRQFSRTLGGTTAMGIALFLVRRSWGNGPAFSLNELAGYLEDPNDASRQRSARESLITKYKPAFEAYGLARFEEAHEGCRKYRISATPLLESFVNDIYVAGEAATPIEKGH